VRVTKTGRQTNISWVKKQAAGSCDSILNPSEDKSTIAWLQQNAISKILFIWLQLKLRLPAIVFSSEYFLKLTQLDEIDFEHVTVVLEIDYYYVKMHF